MLFHPISIILLLLTFMVQEFIPGLEIAQFATLFLPAVFFFSASVAAPFSMMLVLAFITGFIWDARHLPGVVESMAGAEDIFGTARIWNWEQAAIRCRLAFPSCSLACLAH
jgi:hypothetical protein